jgi:hypothetical protein
MNLIFVRQFDHVNDIKLAILEMVVNDQSNLRSMRKSHRLSKYLLTSSKHKAFLLPCRFFAMSCSGKECSGQETALA